MTASRMLAIVPARGNSRGLPRKNLYPLAGRPLIAYTLDAALGTRRPLQIVVSSDDAEILDYARINGVEARRRSAANATDAASSESVIAEVLATQTNPLPPSLVLLQPTSPLRRAADIDTAVDLFERSGADALISVVEPVHHPMKAFITDALGRLAPLFSTDAPFLPRQQLPRAWQPNGAIYIVRTACFLHNHRLLQDHTIAFVMPPERSLDIDTAFDIQLAETILDCGTPEVSPPC